MKSMTGYGEGAAQGRWVKVLVQVRALNHRHLDIQLRVPREYLPFEEELRKVIRQKISRGRIEVFVTRSLLKGQVRTLELDEDLLAQYIKALQRAKRKFALQGEVNLSLFSSLPELFRLRDAELSGAGEGGLILRSLAGALRALERSRRREGYHLKLDVQSQVRLLKEIVSGLVGEARKIALEREDSRPSREELPLPESASLPGDARNQAFKGDIHEEVVRLKSHVAALAALIAGREPMGKKLDFLLQEIQRELNTVGSKAPELTVVRLVLAGKETVEKIREQAQNVE